MAMPGGILFNLSNEVSLNGKPIAQGPIFHQATALKAEDKTLLLLNSLYQHLIQIQGHHARIVMLYRWLNKNIVLNHVIREPLKKALIALGHKKNPGELTECIQLSQRQVERQFKRWIDMTPKSYQRLLRVKNTLNFIKFNPKTELADIALSKGFSDQAHMTI
jgi:AraC-like DNA-binding protein